MAEALDMLKQAADEVKKEIEDAGDEQRNSLVYLAFSDRVIDGSPENSISAVSVMPWPAGEAVQVKK